MIKSNYNVAVLMGGVSSEREISLSTGKAVLSAVKSAGFNAFEVMYNESLNQCMKDLKRADIVFIALHGGDGENGEVQRTLDQNQIVYTGSGPDSSALCMDKIKSKEKVRNAGLLTPDWIEVHTLDKRIELDVENYPVIVKPNDQGSTVGLTIAHNRSELEKGVEEALKYGAPVLVESYIKGREMTVTILDDKAYPVVEIIPSHELYDYECKYSPGMSNYVCPAEITESLKNRLMSASLTIHKILDCRDYSRVDFRIDEDNEPWFLEVNTLPGMTSTSLVPKSVKASGMSFEKLIESIIMQAARRCQ